MNRDEILAYKGHPALLDRLAISTDRGQLMAMFGLGAELYVAPRDRVQLREDMLAVQEDYYHLFKDKLDHFLLDSPKDDGRILKIKDDPFPTIRNAVSNEWPSDQSYTNVIFRRYTHPDFPKDAGTVTPWATYFLVSPEKQEELSFYHCHFPVSADKGKLHFDLLRESLLRWCTILRPAHGAAGYCVILEVGTISGEPYTYATLQRHPGLNFLGSSAFTINAKSIHNRIKSINWLTVLGDEILKELGGMEAARAALEPECTLYPYKGGVVIQAGEVPLLGDTYEGNIPEAYRKVARFTKPVRFEGYTSSLFRVFKPMVGAEEALRWAQRFD